MKLSGTVCCIGTGPSLTMQQVEIARQKGFTLAGCNSTALDVADLSVLYACNYEWWVHFWESVKDHPAEKWTTSREASKRFGVNWIAETNKPGLSTDPKLVHHGHGSGYTLLNLVYLMGAERIVLLGYDLKYARDYDPKSCYPGGTPRHYFGEYPSGLMHWPSERVKNGVHEELIGLYKSVTKQGLVEIVNATPDSALECFPKVPIERL
jgi:hypothetical protein